MTKHDDLFKIFSKKERATGTPTMTAAEEFSQSLQGPSSTHPGTTYPVRAIPHSDIITEAGVAKAGVRAVAHLQEVVLVSGG